MWTRDELKNRAKNVLKTCYWKAFLVSIIIGIFSGGSSGGSGAGGSSYRTGHKNIFKNGIEDPRIWGMIIAVIVIVSMIMLFVIALKVFLGNPLTVGGRKFFIRAAQGEANLNHIGHGLQGGTYWNIVKSMLIKDVYIFLWTLLLIIPGIIKSYAYFMVPYILADNPEMKYDDAINLSKEMTYGHKWNMFVLQLSFIGWYLLGLLAFCIGTMFVVPYQYATEAELYLVLKNSIEE